MFDESVEEELIGFALNHKTGESLSGIERAISAIAGYCFKVEPACLETLSESVPMRRGGDNKGHITGHESCPDQCGEGIDKRGFFFVEEDGMGIEVRVRRRIRHRKRPIAYKISTRTHYSNSPEEPKTSK